MTKIKIEKTRNPEEFDNLKIAPHLKKRKKTSKLFIFYCLIVFMLANIYVSFAVEIAEKNADDRLKDQELILAVYLMETLNIEKHSELKEISGIEKHIALEKLLDFLSFCESSDDENAVGDGGKSLGAYQLQYAIVYDFYLKIHGITISTTDYERISYDSILSRNVARNIIKHNFQGGAENWRNCLKQFINKN